MPPWWLITATSAAQEANCSIDKVLWEMTAKEAFVYEHIWMLKQGNKCTLLNYESE